MNIGDQVAASYRLIRMESHKFLRKNTWMGKDCFEDLVQFSMMELWDKDRRLLNNVTNHAGLIRFSARNSCYKYSRDFVEKKTVTKSKEFHNRLFNHSSELLESDKRVGEFVSQALDYIKRCSDTKARILYSLLNVLIDSGTYFEFAVSVDEDNAGRGTSSKANTPSLSSISTFLGFTRTQKEGLRELSKNVSISMGRG